MFNLLHTTAGQALADRPDLQIALSDKPMRDKFNRKLWNLIGRLPVLRQTFRNTMSGEDTRRPAMEVGLGIWTGTESMYYGLSDIVNGNRYVFDKLGGRTVLIYYGAGATVLSAIYTEANAAEWRESQLILDSGESISDGVVRSADGTAIRPERPMQLFTRWYGYALTFPGTDIWEPSED